MIVSIVDVNLQNYSLDDDMPKQKKNKKVEKKIACHHPGKECNALNCSCIQAGKVCSFDCQCIEYCFNVFKGCNCKNSCNKNCKCHKNKRSCQPDLCKNCYETGSTCHNQEERVRQISKNKIFPGPSSLCPAYGLFAGQELAKDEIICEYIGELISEGEGERRGQLADIQDSNYLYNLDEDFDIDA